MSPGSTCASTGSSRTRSRYEAAHSINPESTCSSSSKTRFDTLPEAVITTLVPKVLQVAAVGGDAALYQRYLDQMKSASAEPERYYRYFNALSWFSDPALVKRTLEFAGCEYRYRIAARASLVERSSLGIHEGSLANAGQDAEHVPGDS